MGTHIAAVESIPSLSYFVFEMCINSSNAYTAPPRQFNNNDEIIESKNTVGLHILMQQYKVKKNAKQNDSNEQQD